jgi:hypothetical protein
MKNKFIPNLCSHLGLTTFTMLLTLAIPVFSQQQTWLDQEKPINWNKPGANIPTAPKSEVNNLSECKDLSRPANTAIDKMVTEAGWQLFGPLEIFGETTLVRGMANADGQCRPLEYQVFVFYNGKFAGTISPVTMNSRTDGSLKNVFLYREKTLNSEFARYQDSDAMCCPSARTSVSFEIETKNGIPLLVPTSSDTSPNS